MPLKCVVCGASVAGLFHYTQDHLPIIGPGIGLMRTTEVALPYCNQHREAFQKRFRILRMVQYGLVAGTLICGVVLWSESLRASFGWDPEPGVISLTFYLLFFLSLASTIFVVKPFLYDAFIECSGSRIRVTSRSRLFIENLIDQNRAGHEQEKQVLFEDLMDL